MHVPASTSVVNLRTLTDRFPERRPVWGTRVRACRHVPVFSAPADPTFDPRLSVGAQARGRVTTPHPTEEHPIAQGGVCTPPPRPKGPHHPRPDEAGGSLRGARPGRAPRALTRGEAAAAHRRSLPGTFPFIRGRGRCAAAAERTHARTDARTHVATSRAAPDWLRPTLLHTRTRAGRAAGRRGGRGKHLRMRGWLAHASKDELGK